MRKGKSNEFAIPTIDVFLCCDLFPFRMFLKSILYASSLELNLSTSSITMILWILISKIPVSFLRLQALPIMERATRSAASSSSIVLHPIRLYYLPVSLSVMSQCRVIANDLTSLYDAMLICFSNLTYSAL